MRLCVLLLVFQSVLCSVIFSQNRTLADSLERIYLENRFIPAEELSLLKLLAEEHSETQRKLHYSELLIEQAEARDSLNYVFTGRLQKGNALRLKGDLSQALESYFQAASIASDRGMTRELGLVDVAIADVYSIMGSHDRSVDYYRAAIETLEQTDDTVNLASAILNAGDEFFNHGVLDSALLNFKRAEELFEALGYRLGLAYTYGNMGLVHAKRGDQRLAEDRIEQAVSMLEHLGDYYPIAVYLTYMSDIYRERGEEDKAVAFADRSLHLARTYGLKEQISDANRKLSTIHEGLGNYSDALKYYKDHVTYRDSVRNISSVQQMADLRADYEVAQKQIEVDLLNEQQRNQRIIVIIISVALCLIFLLAIALYRRNSLIGKANKQIEQEMDRSDQLLLNILPEETAEELKNSGKVQAKKFESVTVLFADFKDFSSFAEGASPEELVRAVDYYFSRFDEIMEQYGLEKIKTIGDAYMAAGGIPFPTSDHAHKMVYAAMDMMEFVTNARSNKSAKKTGFDIRIGINTGPIIAGVVGIKKFAYDIWGDTVNIAARMESTSSPGRINISENTYQIVKESFDCEPRGQVNVKNRGMMNMFFVDGVKNHA